MIPTGFGRCCPFFATFRPCSQLSSTTHTHTHACICKWLHFLFTPTSVHLFIYLRNVCVVAFVFIFMVALVCLFTYIISTQSFISIFKQRRNMPPPLSTWNLCVCLCSCACVRLCMCLSRRVVMCVYGLIFFPFLAISAATSVGKHFRYGISICFAPHERNAAIWQNKSKTLECQ